MFLSGLIYITSLRLNGNDRFTDAGLVFLSHLPLTELILLNKDKFNWVRGKWDKKASPASLGGCVLITWWKPPSKNWPQATFHVIKKLVVYVVVLP